PVGAGERLIVNLKQGQLGVERLAASAEPATRATASDIADVGALVAETSAPKPEPSSQARAARAPFANETQATWSKRVAAGDFDGVLLDAEQLGIDTVLARSALPDLVALADAARYRARTEVARRALLAQ